MNKKISLLSFFSLCFLFSAFAQMKVTESNEIVFELKKNTTCESFSVNGNTLFLLKYYQTVQNYYHLLSLNGSGRLTDEGDVTIPVGTMGDMNDINSFHQVGNNMYILVENRNKSAGQNTLSIKKMAENGDIGNVVKKVGFIPFSKMINPGDWFAYTTPDKNHLAIVSVYPKEKDIPLQGKYYFFDAQLNEIYSGDISLEPVKKKGFSLNLFASDKGDIYLINREFDNTYTFPVVYTKLAAENKFTEFPVLLPEKIKNLDYTAGISNTGSLLIAGFTQPKQGFRMGDVQSNGSFLYNTDYPTEIITKNFEGSIANLKATSLVCREGTMYLTGEQIVAVKESNPVGVVSFDENYNYKFGNIVVTAYDLAEKTKFDLQMTRNFAAKNFTADLTPATGFVNSKFTILFNDELRKYVKDASTYKVPVMNTITKEGLLEQPIHYEKEFRSTSSGFVALTVYDCINGNTISLLANNGNRLKAFQLK